MFIARYHTAEGTGLVLGLTRQNVNKLIDHKPMRLRQPTHPGIPEGLTIDIVFGEDELAIKKLFDKAGVITADTKVHIDPRLNEA